MVGYTEADDMIIVYKNRYNEVKAYSLKLTRELEDRFDAIQTDTGQIKTFIKGNILADGFLSFDRADKEAKSLQQNYELNFPQRMPSRDGWNNKEGKFEVCFTGFRRADKEHLEVLATETGFRVRSKPTKGLGLLVCGYNAGPSKVAEATRMAVPVVHEIEGFINYIEKGKGFNKDGKKAVELDLIFIVTIIVLGLLSLFLFI
jgi:hypothetical protein